MKPAKFAYHAPTGLPEALDLLATLAEDDADVRVLAGGQSILPMLNLRLAQPEHVVDINGITELTDVEARNGHVAVGALVRQRAAERHELIASACPLLAEALPFIGHLQIRNRGTIGGSVAHADPAAEIPTVALALGAEITLSSARGTRDVPAAEFFRGYLETAVEPGELLTAVRFPRPSGRTGTAFAEVSRRHGDFALVGVAASVELGADDAVADARLAFLGVGATPVRADAAEAALRGRPLDADAAGAAATAVAEQLDPRGDLHASADYRRHVAGELTRRVLATAADRARGAGLQGSDR